LTVYAYFHSISRGELRELTEVDKIAKKDIVRGFKVIQGHRICHNRKGICNFLLVVVTVTLSQLL